MTAVSTTGTGNVVLATSPTLVTPNIGTPSAGVLTNCTGLPVSTGIAGLAAGVATFLATPTSANLAAAVTDKTGTGALVFANGPTFNSTVTMTATLSVGGTVSVTGNAAFGGAPLTSWTLYKAIEIGRVGAAFAVNPSGLVIDIHNNSYYNAGYKYAADGGACLIEANNGTLAFYTTASGLTGNAITWTSRLQIDDTSGIAVNANTAITGTLTTTGAINKVAITAPATAATLTIADGKTLTVSNTLTFTGTDASSVAFGTGGTVLYSGGALGTPSSGSLVNLTGAVPTAAQPNITSVGTLTGLAVSSTGAAVALTQSGAGGATYYVFDNTVEVGGKRWRFGYTGGAGTTVGGFSLYNQTDNATVFNATASTFAITPAVTMASTLTVNSTQRIAIGAVSGVPMRVYSATNTGGGIGVGNSLQMEWAFNNASSAETVYSDFVSVIKANTAGAETGQLVLRNKVAGTMTSIINLDGNSIGLNGNTAITGTLSTTDTITVTKTEALLALASTVGSAKTWQMISGGGTLGSAGNFYLRQSTSGASPLIVDSTASNATLYIGPSAAVAITGTLSTTSGVTAMSGTAIPAGGTAGAGLMVSSTANFGAFFGSGAPTLSAAKGSIYLRSDGSTTNNRAYINTDGATTWTALTTAA